VLHLQASRIGRGETLIGTNVSHCRLTAKIAEGGMGEVYVGFDEALARKVAMKAIREDRRPSAEARARSCARPGYSRSPTTPGSAGSSTTSRGTRWTSSSWSWSRDDPSGWRCPPGSSPPGRNALDGVAAKALDYFASIGDQELAAGDRFRRSLHEAHVLARDLVVRQPGNGEWLMGLGAIEFWIGNVHWLQGDLAGAEQRFEAYLDVAQRLVRIDGANPEWRLELSHAHSNLGSVQEARGNVDAAIEHFRLTVDARRELVRADPTRGQQDLADSLSWLGEALFGAGDLAGAPPEARHEEPRAAAAGRRLQLRAAPRPGARPPGRGPRPPREGRDLPGGRAAAQRAGRSARGDGGGGRRTPPAAASAGS